MLLLNVLGRRWSEYSSVAVENLALFIVLGVGHLRLLGSQPLGLLLADPVIVLVDIMLGGLGVQPFNVIFAKIG